jgi:hypothetical protein
MKAKAKQFTSLFCCSRHSSRCDAEKSDFQEKRILNWHSDVWPSYVYDERCAPVASLLFVLFKMIFMTNLGGPMLPSTIAHALMSLPYIVQHSSLVGIYRIRCDDCYEFSTSQLNFRVGMTINPRTVDDPVAPDESVQSILEQKYSTPKSFQIPAVDRKERLDKSNALASTTTLSTWYTVDSLTLAHSSHVGQVWSVTTTFGCRDIRMLMSTLDIA